MNQSPFDAVAQTLRELESKLRPWLQRSHRWPVRVDLLKQFSQHADDLLRQARELKEARPCLVVVLMGGTGVGKSSLLNALAQGTIAEAAFTRPTTREPIVYLHEDFDEQRLDEALRQCRKIRHRQSGLEHKILVDTPDLDSNETIHRERLEAVLPCSDIVLYVGSQEKYHDQAGWELFLKHKERRAFAFVLNKWDRCLAQHATGVRPDEDLLRDLKAEGFTEPLLFRTCAQLWIKPEPGQDLPEGEQFGALKHWLEQGLTKREIEAIRSKGIEQLVTQLHALQIQVQPPDVQSAARATEAIWRTTSQTEVSTQTEIILSGIAPHQKMLERRFASHLSHPFKGLMGSFANGMDFLRHGLFRSKLPQLTDKPTEPQVSDLAGFAATIIRETNRQSLAARTSALGDRLLAKADDAGLPIHRLNDDLQSQLKGITEATYCSALTKSLLTAEQSLAGPNSWRQRMAGVWTWVGQLLPLGTFLLILAWQVYAKIVGTMYVSITDIVLLPPLAGLFVMVILYVLYRSLVPVTWKKLSPICGATLRAELSENFQTAIRALPQQQATLLADERHINEALIAQTTRAKELIQQQEQSSQVAILYAQ